MPHFVGRWDRWEEMGPVRGRLTRLSLYHCSCPPAGTPPRAAVKSNLSALARQEGVEILQQQLRCCWRITLPSAVFSFHVAWSLHVFVVGTSVSRQQRSAFRSEMNVAEIPARRNCARSSGRCDSNALSVLLYTTRPSCGSYFQGSDSSNAA